MSYLIITGSFACGMAFHNTTARYMYSLGREGLAPRALGKTHPRWKSPHIASLTQTVIAAVIIGLFAIFTGSDNPNSQAYLQLYGLMAVMGVIIILSVQAVVSLAVLIYYERFHSRRGALVADQARSAARLHLPGLRGVPAVHEHRASSAEATVTRTSSARSTPWSWWSASAPRSTSRTACPPSSSKPAASSTKASDPRLQPRAQ